MAMTTTPKVDEGTPACESKRTKVIQSEVEAAAAREAQDFYITRLTENYKQKLDIIGQGYEAQSQEIQELKSQIAANAEQTRQDCKTKKETGFVIESLKAQLATTTERRREDQGAKHAAVEAAETYKLKLDAMEQGQQAQRQEIQTLKPQLDASNEVKKEHGNQGREMQDLLSQFAAQQARERRDSNKTVALAGKKITDVKTELAETKSQLAKSQKSTTAGKTELDKTRLQLEESQKSNVALEGELDGMRLVLEASRTSCALNSERAKKAEWEIPHLKRRHAAKLKAALEDEDGFVEIGFKKLWVTKVSAKASLAVKRRSATFRELAKMGLKSDSLGLRKFEYEGRKITPVDYDKTLSEVSGVLLETGHCRQLTNAWVLAWV